MVLAFASPLGPFGKFALHVPQPCVQDCHSVMEGRCPIFLDCLTVFSKTPSAPLEKAQPDQIG